MDCTRGPAGRVLQRICLPDARLARQWLNSAGAEGIPIRAISVGKQAMPFIAARRVTMQSLFQRARLRRERHIHPFPTTRPPDDWLLPL